MCSSMEPSVACRSSCSVTPSQENKRKRAMDKKYDWLSPVIKSQKLERIQIEYQYRSLFNLKGYLASMYTDLRVSDVDEPNCRNNKRIKKKS